MKLKAVIIMSGTGLLIGCGSIESRIDVPTTALPVTPEFVVDVKNGSMDTFRGVDLAIEVEPPDSIVSTSEADEDDMTEEPNNTYRITPGSPMPLGTRIEGTWTARFRPAFGFADRIVTQTKQAHVGHDIRLIGLKLVDADGDELPEFTANMPGVADEEGCRTVTEGEPFKVVIEADNPSFTYVPEALFVVGVNPLFQASSSPGSHARTLVIPAEAEPAEFEFGPFTGVLPEDADIGVVEVSARGDPIRDFNVADNEIRLQQSGETVNLECFDESGNFDRDRCQACLIVEQS